MGIPTGFTKEEWDKISPIPKGYTKEEWNKLPEWKKAYIIAPKGIWPEKETADDDNDQEEQ